MPVGSEFFLGRILEKKHHFGSTITITVIDVTDYNKRKTTANTVSNCADVGDQRWQGSAGVGDCGILVSSCTDDWSAIV